MRLVLSEESADHSFVYQYRLGSNRQYKHKLSAGIFLCPPALNLRIIPVIKAAKEDKNNQ